MIRLAKETDLDNAIAVYDEIFDYEREHGSYSNWQKDLYPTRMHLERAQQAGTLFVGETENGEIYGCVILNHEQPKEYDQIQWQVAAEGNEVFVIHTLAIRPKLAGNGYAKRMIAFAEELAKQKQCKTLRLDTHEGNKPAATLYQSLGYVLQGDVTLLFQDVLWETIICLDKKL